MAHHDVFLSYSSQDKLTADAACAALEARGIRCWIAPRDITPGTDWSDAIIDGIAGCRVFLLILSSASNESEQVKREVQNAVSEAKPILPFRIENVALSKHMRYFIGTPHWLDALTPPMERHLQKMVETLASWIASLDSKTPANFPALLPLDAALWETSRLAQIETELRVFIGTSGPTLMGDTVAVAADYDDLCRRLSGYILSEQERQTFLARCGALTHPPEFCEVVPLAAKPSAALSADVIAAAGKVLAHYVGPLGPMIARRTAKQVTELEEFYRRLSEELPTPAEKTAFLRQTRR